MTEKLYDADSKRKDFDATILSCEWNEKKGLYQVIPDRTVFFPESGGQYADRGTLGGCEVEDVKERDGELIHYLKQALPVGSTVHGEIDYKERYERMRQHSGEHIVSGLIHQKFGYDNVGFHLGNFVTTMDFNGPLKEEEVREIETAANAVIAENLPISVNYPSKEELAAMTYRSKKEIEGQVRIVTIPGVDVCACCAPHVERTGEIGLIKLTDARKYKGGTRISLLAGGRALADYRDKEASVKEISRLLSAKEEEVTDAVKRLQEEAGALQGKIAALQSQMLTEKLSEIKKGSGHYILFEDETDPNAARRFVDAGMRRGCEVCGIFIGNDEDGYRYILGSVNRNMREFLPDFLKACDGKGGGLPEMVQGTVRAEKKTIEAYFDHAC